MHFGENQLSPGSIGISPLPTPHPPPFQRRSVRAFTQFYLRFTLDMGSSPGFGSTTANYYAHLGLAFAAAPELLLLNLARYSNSPARSTKSTPSPFDCRQSNRALTACRHTVSGSISLPSRGAFHLSLTVLVHYRSPEVFSLGGWSPLIPAGFHVSRSTWDQNRSPPELFEYGALTRYGRTFQPCSPKSGAPPGRPPPPMSCPSTPITQRRQALTRDRFWLTRFRSPLLTGSRLIPSPRTTKMFQFVRCPSRTYVFSTE